MISQYIFELHLLYFNCTLIVTYVNVLMNMASYVLCTVYEDFRVKNKIISTSYSRYVACIFLVNLFICYFSKKGEYFGNGYQKEKTVSCRSDINLPLSEK